MNKAIARNLDTDYIPVQRLCALLETFALKHSSKQLADLLEKAENENASYREFLRSVLETEVKGRNERRRKRNYAGAHFPTNVRSLEEFDPSELEAGITDGQIRQLKDLTWLDTYGNIVLAGPPGLGKTMIAVGLGLEAINNGYTVCFEKMVNLIKILDAAGNETYCRIPYQEHQEDPDDYNRRNRIYSNLQSTG